MSPVKHLKACGSAYSFSNAIVIFPRMQTGAFLLTLMVILVLPYDPIIFIKSDME